MNDNSIFSLNKFRKIKSDDYNNKDDYMKNFKLRREKYISNPRFKGFDQIYYSAGNRKDIEKYGLLPLRYYYSLKYLEKNEKKGEKNEKKEKKTPQETLFKLYKNIDYRSIMNTFDYMFYKFKKGIFIMICGNKLALFLPFSKVHYKNEEELNINIYKNMLDALLKECKINDVEFFINLYDFPILKKDLMEPYDRFFDGEKKDLYDKMCPIFSKSVSDKYADIMIPNEDDSTRVSNKLKYLGKEGVFNYMEQKLNAIHKNKVTKNCLDIDKKILGGVKKNIAIIACFRDLLIDGERERERKIYVQLMNKLLVPYCNFHIYIIEQSDDGQLFNIGKLKNIGFEIATHNKNMSFDHYIFTDIDAIPDYDLIKYFLITPSEPIGLAIRGTRYESHRIKERSEGRPEKIFLGALVSFSKKNFEDINGYPNNFWGWGGEDDSLIQRIKHAGYKNICYPIEGNIIDIEEDEYMKTINDPEVKIKGEKKDLEKFEKRYNDLTSWKKNGLNSLEYKVLGKNRINRDTTQIRVDLMKNEDMKKYPEWFPKPINNYKTLQRKLAKMDTEMVVKYI
jgi:hypothetical protein